MITKNVKLGGLIFICSIVLLFLSIYQVLGAIAIKRIDPNLFFNPDALTHGLIFRDLFIDRNNFYKWYFADSPSFFPDLAIYSVVYFLTGGSYSLALVLNALLIYVGILVFLALILRKIYVEATLTDLALIFFLGSILLNLMTKGRFFLLMVFILSPNFHVGTLLITLAGLLLCILLLKTNSILLYAVFFFTIFLTAVSDKLLIMHFIAPLVCALVCLAIKNIVEKNKIIKIGFVMFMALILGLGLYDVLITIKIPRTLGFSNIFLNNFVRDLGLYFTTPRLSSTIAGKEYYFPNDEALLILASIVLLFICATSIFKIWFLPKSYKTPPGLEKTLVLHFLFFLYLSDLSGIILSQLYMGLIHLRYITPLLFLPIFFICFHIFIKQRKNIKIIVLSLLMTLLLLNFNLYNPKEILALESYKSDLVRCLDEKASKYNLSYGISDYWNAERVSFSSQAHLKVNAIETPTDRLPIILYWNSNLDWYTKGDPHYNFVVTERLNRDKLINLLGEPSEEFECASTTILTYKNANIDNFINGALAFEKLKYMNMTVSLPTAGLRGELINSKGQPDFEKRKFEENNIVLTNLGDKEGPFYYHFPIFLYPGEYKVILEYEDVGGIKTLTNNISVKKTDITYIKDLKSVDISMKLENLETIILKNFQIKKIS